MTQIRASLEHGFKGEDVVLMSFDQESLADIAAFFKAARASSSFNQHGIEIDLVIDAQQPCSVEFLPSGTMKASLTPDKANEVYEKLVSMNLLGKPCHQYVSIDRPVGTLVLSLAEYPLDNT